MFKVYNTISNACSSNRGVIRKVGNFAPNKGNTSLPFQQARPQSLSAQLRREKSRQFLISPQDPDAPLIIFPYERLGNQVKVNFQFAYHGVPPSGEAFRNLNNRQLIQRSTCKVDKQKAIHVDADATPKDYQYKIGDGQRSISAAKFDKLFREVKRNLSEAESIYMHDGAIGSHSSVETPVRVITDDVNATLYLSNILSKLPSSRLDAPGKLIVYFATNFNNASSFDIKGKAFSIFNRDLNTLVIGGTNSTTALSNSLFNAASSIALSKNAVPVVGDTITLENGKNVVVINNDGLLLKQKLKNKLVGANNLYLTSNGVARAWDGVNYSSLDAVQLQRGNLVEKRADNSYQVTVPLSSPTLLESPTSVVFLISDATGSLPTFSKLNPSQAAQYYASGFDGKGFKPFNGLEVADTASFIKNFKDALGSRAGLYIINAHQLPANDLQHLLLATTNGTANSAAVSKAAFKSLSPISSLGAIKLNPGNPQKESTFTNFISSTFPNVAF